MFLNINIMIINEFLFPSSAGLCSEHRGAPVSAVMSSLRLQLHMFELWTKV